MATPCSDARPNPRVLSRPGRTRGHRLSGGDVEDQSEDVPNLIERGRAHIASDVINPGGRHRSDVLALGARPMIQAVPVVGFDRNLGPEPTDGRCERDDVDDVGICIEDSLGCHHHSRMTEAGFPSRGRTEIYIGDIT